jgi:hypothetical protein
LQLLGFRRCAKGSNIAFFEGETASIQCRFQCMFVFAGNGNAGVLPEMRTQFPAFPYDPPYPIQRDFMAAVYSRLQSGGIGLFESPTGKQR